MRGFENSLTSFSPLYKALVPADFLGLWLCSFDQYIRPNTAKNRTHALRRLAIGVSHTMMGCGGPFSAADGLFARPSRRYVPLRPR